MSISVISEDDLKRKSVLSEYGCTYSDAFNEQYEELQKNLVFTPSTEQLWFECETCKRKCATQERLERHMKQKHSSPVNEKKVVVAEHPSPPASSPSEPFKCTVCKFACLTNADLMRHAKKHWGVKPYVCKICGKRFSQKGNLKPHMLRHSGVSPFSCDFCPKTFNHRTSRKKHMEEHTNPKEFACRFCNSASFNSINERNSHELTKHSQDDVDCIICGVILNSALGLKMHISQMHPEFPGANQLASEKKWACQYCNKKFSTKAYLIVHHKIHRGEKPFKCDKCSYTAVSKDSIKKHDERAHGTMRPLSCNLCSKTFMYYSHKKAHMLRHYNLKPFNCELCTRSFMLKRHLIDHMRLHEGKQNFRCDLCNVAYVLPDSLRKHKDMHLNVPLKCHICETDFWITGRYNRHMQKHRREFHGNARSGNKPYKCQSCSKGFKQRRFLVRHIADGCQRKGNSRLLKCTECDFKFFDQKALKIHMKIFHNLKEHSCYICAEAFKRISQLNQHLIEKHNEHTNESVKREIPYSSSDEDCVGKGIVLLPNESDEEANKILFIDETPIKDSIKLEPIDSFETSFDCFSCDDRFDSQDSLQSHCKLAHESDSSADNIPSITSLVVKEEKSPLKFDDSVDSQGFDQLGYEFVPVEGGTSDDVDTEIETYECTVCGASFATYELCQRHYDSRHEKKNKFKRGRRKK